MSADYVNDFSVPDPDNRAFAPTTNTYGLSSPTGTVIKPFGDMLAGTSFPFAHYVLGPTGTTPPPIPSSDLPIRDASGGITLQLLSPTQHQTSNSRTMYLTHLKHGSTFFLPLDAKLNAEIVFDLPSGSDKPGQTRCNSKQFKWGVGLILKSGDQNEYPDDQLMGPTCQFFNGGSINFHGTDYCRPGADLQDLSTCPQEVPGGTYKYVGTTFSLSLSLWRNIEEIDLPPLSGNATFSLNRPGKTEVYSGDLLMQDRRLKMEDGITPVPYYDIDWVRALGVSLVCAQNDLTDMSIRLKRFTVSVTPRP